MTYHHLCWVLLIETVISPAYTQRKGVNLHKEVNTKEVGITGSHVRSCLMYLIAINRKKMREVISLQTRVQLVENPGEEKFLAKCFSKVK